MTYNTNVVGSLVLPRSRDGGLRVGYHLAQVKAKTLASLRNSRRYNQIQGKSCKVFSTKCNRETDTWPWGAELKGYGHKLNNRDNPEPKT